MDHAPTNPQEGYLAATAHLLLLGYIPWIPTRFQITWCIYIYIYSHKFIPTIFHTYIYIKHYITWYSKNRIHPRHPHEIQIGSDPSRSFAIPRPDLWTGRRDVVGLASDSTSPVTKIRWRVWLIWETQPVTMLRMIYMLKTRHDAIHWYIYIQKDKVYYISISVSETMWTSWIFDNVSIAIGRAKSKGVHPVRLLRVNGFKVFPDMMDKLIYPLVN